MELNLANGCEGLPLRGRVGGGRLFKGNLGKWLGVEYLQGKGKFFDVVSDRLWLFVVQEFLFRQFIPSIHSVLI